MIRRNSFRLGSTSNMGGSHKITIRLLDDNEILQLDFQPHHKGQFLMDYVCRQLNIAEKDYFGLRYVDSNKQRHWLDLNKSILKQLKDMSPYITCVRFKFYPSDPMLLKESVTRYQLILQLRRDMLHGRLYSNVSDMASLSAYIIQAELGDYDPEVHTENYIAQYELVSRQTPEFEAKVMELHQPLKGTSAAESDEAFLKKAIALDTYGVDPHPVKDQQGEQVYLGINYTGISTFQGSKKSTHFKWSQITKLNYEAKMFIIHVSISEDSRNRKKETVGFKCQSFSACKYLWCCAVEQRLFFNCGSSNEIPNSVRGGGLFGTRFRYAGRVQKEVIDDPGPLRATDGVIQRTPLYRSLQRSKTRSLQSSPLQEYSTLPRSNHSAPIHESTRIDGDGVGPVGSSTSLPLSAPYCPDHTTPMLETLLEDSPKSDKELGEFASTEIGQEVDIMLQESTAENSTIEPKLVNGIGQSECQKQLIRDDEATNELTVFHPVSPPILSSITEEVEPESKANSIPKFLPLHVNSTYVDKFSPSWAISSLLANSYSPETDNTPFRFPHENVDLPKLNENIKSCSTGQIPATDQDEIGKAFQNSLPTEDIACNVSLSSEFVSLSNQEFEDNKLPSSALDPKHSNQKRGYPDILNADDIAVHKVNPLTIIGENGRVNSRKSYGDHLSGSDTGGESTIRESKIEKTSPNFQQTLVASSSAGRSFRWPSRNTQDKLLSIWKIFIVSFFCVFLAALIVAVLVIETDLGICERMRRIPEIQFFSSELYMPFKLFVREKFTAFGKLFR